MGSQEDRFYSSGITIFPPNLNSGFAECPDSFREDLEYYFRW